jgi:hypothetical protein
VIVYTITMTFKMKSPNLRPTTKFLTTLIYILLTQATTTRTVLAQLTMWRTQGTASLAAGKAVPVTAMLKTASLVEEELPLPACS